MPRHPFIDWNDPTLRVVTPDEARTILAAQATRKAERAAAHAERKANGPTARLRALQIGESHLFTQYRSPTQLGRLIADVGMRTGARFTCATERNLSYAALIDGVRVTRTA